MKRLPSSTRMCNIFAGYTKRNLYDTLKSLGYELYAYSDYTKKDLCELAVYVYTDRPKRKDALRQITNFYDGIDLMSRGRF
jgi:predicted ATP-grasp superfamily ATP-dependent carboligase